MKNVISLFAKNLVSVAMRTAEAFYNIFMYLYNKNILKYGQIVRNGTESMIPDNEGRSNLHSMFHPSQVPIFFQVCEKSITIILLNIV